MLPKISLFRFLSYIVLISCVCFITPKAFSMAVTPVVIDLKSLGSKATSFIEIFNNSTTDLPVEIVIKEIEIGKNGITQKETGAEDFSIYPKMTKIKPGQVQRVRVKFIGNPELEKSKSYLFSVNQQSLPMSKGQSGIQIVYNFQVFVNVGPNGKIASLSFISGEFKEIEGIRRAVLQVTNPSDVHAYLSGAKITITATDKKGETIWTKVFNPEELGQKIGLGIMQPGVSRQFVLPFDLPEGGESLTASVKYVGRK